MSAIIKKIAQYLINNWNKIPGWVQSGIKSIAGSVIVDYIVNGFDSLVAFLSTLSSTVIQGIATLLGL